MKITCFIAVMLAAFSANAQPAKDLAKNRGSELTIPFAILADFGHRPAIEGFINGFPVKLEIHSNAGLYMQISHKAADTSKIGNRTHVDKFGIQAVGKVSDMGRDSAFIDKFSIKSKTYNHIPVTIFETPSRFDVGMLGLRWLTANRVVVDYAKQAVVLNSTKESANMLQRNLLQHGYLSIPMKRDTSDGRYLIQVELNGISRPMIVSTVSSNTFDSNFADAAHIASSDNGDKAGGPSGTVGSIYKVKGAVKLIIDNHIFLVKNALVEDNYAYMAKKRPADISQNRAGLLAADFLIAHQAVIDFGNSILYLSPQP